MKRAVLVATALLLVVPILSACGVAQEEYDAVVAERDAANAQVSSLQSDLDEAESDLAAAQSTLTKAQSDLAAAQSAKAAAESAKATADSAKAKAQSDLAAAQAQVADLEAQVAELEAAAEEAVVEEEVVEEEEVVVEEEEEVAPTGVTEVTTTFEAAEYVNAAPSFSVKYPSTWVTTEVTGAPWKEGTVFNAGTGPYNLPRVSVWVIDAAAAATVEDAIKVATGDPDAEIASSEATTTADGTTATKALVYYISGTFPIDGWFMCAKKGDKWVIVCAATITMYFPLDEALAWEIGSTLLFK